MFNWYHCPECREFKPPMLVGGRDKYIVAYGGCFMRMLGCGHAIPRDQKPVPRPSTQSMEAQACEVDPMEAPECETKPMEPS